MARHPAIPSPSSLAIEGICNLKTERQRRESTKTASWNRSNQQVGSGLAPILQKESGILFQTISVSSFPNSAALHL